MADIPNPADMAKNAASGAEDAAEGAAKDAASNAASNLKSNIPDPSNLDPSSMAPDTPDLSSMEPDISSMVPDTPDLSSMEPDISSMAPDLSGLDPSNLDPSSMTPDLSSIAPDMPSMPNIPDVGGMMNDKISSVTGAVTDKVDSMKQAATDKANSVKETIEKKKEEVKGKLKKKAPVAEGAAEEEEEESKQFITVTIPAWPDEKDANLEATSFEWHAEISKPYLGALKFKAKTLPGDVKVENLLGKPVSLRFVTFDEDDKIDMERYFHGLIQNYSYSDPGAEADEKTVCDYEITIVPWLWFLTQRADCKIFQNKTVKDIFEEVFQNAGFKDYDLSKLNGHYKQREYCVQYKETDFNFVSRLLEEEGIFYFFKHEKEKHTLVLAENVNAYGNGSESQEVDRTKISKWKPYSQVIPTGFACNSHDFENPDKNLLAQSESATELPLEKLKIYNPDYSYTDGQEGEGIGKRFTAAFDCRYKGVLGSSEYCDLCVGGKIQLEAASFPHESKVCNEYVITKVEFTTTGNPKEYKNTFTGLDAKVVYRPLNEDQYDIEDDSDEEENKTQSGKYLRFKELLRIKQPKIYGIQEAEITGPDGEEIYTDGYGRVRIQFHWDRCGEKNENSSCWIRVSANLQMLLGIPRIGRTVLVIFLNGNPDQPIVTNVIHDGKWKPVHDWKGKKYSRGVVIGKHREVINDDPKSPSREVTNPGMLKETVEKDHKVTVKGDCTLEGNNITHEAKEKFDAQGKTSATLQGNAVKVKSDTTTDVEAGTSTTIKGNAMTKIEGGTVNIGTAA